MNISDSTLITLRDVASDISWIIFGTIIVVACALYILDYHKRYLASKKVNEMVEAPAAIRLLPSDCDKEIGVIDVNIKHALEIVLLRIYQAESWRTRFSNLQRICAFVVGDINTFQMRESEKTTGADRQTISTNLLTSLISLISEEMTPSVYQSIPIYTGAKAGDYILKMVRTFCEYYYFLASAAPRNRAAGDSDTDAVEKSVERFLVKILYENIFGKMPLNS